MKEYWKVIFVTLCFFLLDLINPLNPGGKTNVTMILAEFSLLKVFLFGLLVLAEFGWQNIRSLSTSRVLRLIIFFLLLELALDRSGRVSTDAWKLSALKALAFVTIVLGCLAVEWIWQTFRHRKNSGEGSDPNGIKIRGKLDKNEWLG